MKVIGHEHPREDGAPVLLSCAAEGIGEEFALTGPLEKDLIVVTGARDETDCEQVLVSDKALAVGPGHLWILTDWVGWHKGDVLAR